MHGKAILRRRWALGGVAAVAAVALMSGCSGTPVGGDDEGGSTSAAGGGESSAAGGSTELTLWTEWSGGYEAAATALLDGFKTENADITLSHRAIGDDDFFEAIRTGLTGNNPPDILQYEGYQQTRDFAAAGNLVDITDLWDQVKDKYMMPDSLVKACEYDGKVYCLPFDLATVNQLFYNKDMYEENGWTVPTNYDELMTLAEQIKATGIAPFALGAQAGWPAEHWFIVFVAQRCGEETVYKAINQDGAKWTDPCFVQAADDLAALAEKGYFTEGVASDVYDGQVAALYAGKAANMLTGTWFITSWIDSPPPFDMGIMPMPKFTDAAFPNDIQATVSQVVGITAKSAHPEEAKRFLEYLVSDAATKIWVTSGQMSPIEGAVDQYGDDTVKTVFQSITSAEGMLPYLENEVPPSLGEDVLYKGATAVAAGQMSGADWMADAQAAAEAAG